MSTDTIDTTSEETVPVRAHGTVVKQLVLTGEMRSAEVRIHRGGVATLSAMCSREYVADALRARREGRYPTIDDPSR